MAKSTKGKKTVAPAKSWQDNVKEAVVNDDEWKCHVVLLAEGDFRFTDYLNMFHEAATKGLRRCVKSINYMEEIKNSRIQNVRRGGAAKQKKQDAKGAADKGSAKLLSEAQQALQDALKEVKNKPYEVPGDLLAVYVKLLVMMIREADIEMSAMQLELKLEIERENAMMLSAGAAKKGKGGGKGGGSEKSSAKPGKGKDAKSPENMHINKLHKRGQEWRIQEYIEDQPADGPQMYIALSGFLHSELPRYLHEFGVPLTAIIKVTEKQKIKQVPIEPFREPGSSQEFKSILNRSTSSLCKWKDPEELVPLSPDLLAGALTSSSENTDITPFWEGLKLLEEEDPFCLKDVALVAFHVPDFPEDSKELELDAELTPETTNDSEKPKVEKKTKQTKNKKNAKNEEDEERGNAVYELVSNILYCVENISHQHQNFLDQTEMISLDSTPLIEEIPVEENLQLYQKMISLVPAECLTVPVILHCLLEQVDVLCNPPDELSLSVSSEKQKSLSEKRKSQNSQAGEARKQTLRDLPATESYTASSENKISRISQGLQQSSSSFTDKRGTRISYAPTEVQESEYIGEYHILEPEESKQDLKKSRQYRSGVSRNEYLLKEPNVILHGDAADLLTFHLEMRDMDIWSIIVQMLETNPAALLWNKYPPLHPMQYIKSNYDFNRLWHAMGGSPKCSRGLLRSFLALATFEQLRNVGNQVATDSPEPQGKEAYNSTSEKNVSVDVPNVSVITDLCSKTVSCIKQEDAPTAESKLQFPFPLLCDIYLTPFRMEGTDELANDDLNRSSMQEVELKKEKSAILTKGTNERARSLSGVHEMIECPELMQLLESQRCSSECRERDCPYITSTHRNLEQLNKPVMLQTLQKYLETFKSLKYKFSPLMDELLLYFYHGDKYGIWKEKWCVAIESPLALRDFYDYILYQKAKESAQRALAQNNLLEATNKEDITASIKEGEAEPRFTDKDFILESSIKFKVNMEKKAKEEEQARLEDSVKGKKDKKAKKGAKAEEPSEGSLKPEDDKKTKSDEKGLKPIKTGSKEIPSQEESQTLVKEEFQYQIYDLGPLRMQYSGSSVQQLGSDQCYIRVDVSQWLYGIPQIYSQFYKHGHTLSLYTYFKQSIGPFVKEPLMFNLLTAKGVFITFTKSRYKPPSQKIPTTPSVPSDTKLQEAEKLKNKDAKAKTKGAKKNKDAKKPEKEPEPILEDNEFSDTVEEIPYYNLKITWPNSLLIETVMKLQVDEEHSEKLCTIVPIGIDQLYIRQRYYDKGPECGPLFYESYRCVLCNGNVLKFMTDDTLEVLTAYGTIYYINTLLKPEPSTPFNNTDRRSTKLPGKENDTVKTAAAQKGRHEQKQQKTKSFFVNNPSETEKLTLPEPEIPLWQIKEYEVLNPDGVLFSINKETGTIDILQRMLFDINHDFRTGEILTQRGDGTSILLLPGGNLITTYPDKTTVCTVLHETVFEWTLEEREELRIAEWKIKLQMYQFLADHGELSMASYEAFEQLNEEMNRAMEELGEEGGLSPGYFDQDAYPAYEEFVMVNTTILVEHPNYATVTYEEVEKDVVITNPHGLEVKIMQKDIYSVKLDSNTFANVKPDIIQYQANDRDSNMTSYTEINLSIVKEEKDPVPEETESAAPKEETESVKAKTNSAPVEEKPSEDADADIKTEKSSCVLSCTTDSKGNVTLVCCNGEIENHQIAKLPRKSNVTLQQMNNSLAHSRCIILRRDLSGYEMINDQEKTAQFEMLKAMDDVCTDKDPVIGSVNLCSYTTIAPVYNSASQEWLMSTSELIKNIKKKDLIPSTYGPSKSWTHPFNLSDQKLQKLQENFGIGDGEKQKKPLAVTLRIIQEIFAIGINIASELKEGLSRYKSKAEDMCASYLSYEYAPDEEEEEILEILNRIADSPENVIRKYRIALLEKSMLKQVTEQEYHKRTRHPSICMRKLIDEALQADYYKDLIRNYPKRVPPYFDSVPGMCFKLVLQTADDAMEKVEENSEENLSQKLLSMQSLDSSSDGNCECIGAVMDKAYQKLLPKSTPSKEAWKMVLESIDEEARAQPTMADIDRAAKDRET